MIDQDLAVTQYTAKDEVYNLADVKSTDKLLWVSEDNIVVKRSEAYGGKDEMTIVENTSVTVHLTADDTGRLSALGSSCKLYRIINDLPVDEFGGDITVTEAEPPSPESVAPVEQVSNEWNHITTTLTVDLNGKHNIVFINPSNLIERNANLPSAITLQSKRFIIKNVGQGTVSVRKPDDTELINLDPTEKVVVYARGLTNENDWQTLDS